MKQLYTFDTKTPDVGKKVFIAPGAVLVGDVTVGDESSIWFNAVIRGDIGSIKIGKKVNVQDGAVIHTMDGKECVIGDGVTTQLSNVLVIDILYFIYAETANLLARASASITLNQGDYLLHID